MPDLIARRPLDGRYLRTGTITLSEGRCADGDHGLAYIDVTGAGTHDLLGSSAQGATRLASLRVSIVRTDNPEAAQITVERFSADYLWAWLVDRASLTSV